MKPRILVTSASGKTGSAAVIQFLEKGFPVRAFVRRQDQRAERLRQAGAEIFAGDQLDMRDLRSALADVQRACHIPPLAPNLLHGAMLFALAAEEAKLEVVALLSQWNPHPTHPSIGTREHWLANNLYRYMRNVDVIHINPGWFADNYFLVFQPVAQLGIFAMPLGEGRNAPPSNEDIARAAVGALTNPAPHIGKSYRPTGPELLSGHDIAEIFAKVLGRKVKFQDVPNKMLIKAARASGIPPFETSQLLYYSSDHRLDAFAIGAPTSHVLELSGQEPEDFETITRRYVATRPEAIQSLGNKLKALFFMVKMMMSRAPDMERWERRRGHPMLTNPLLAPESDEWRASAERQTLAILENSD